jgi:lipoyl-dependent peroxiredoxin
MKKRNGTAVWNGPGKTGNGKLSTQSGVLKDAQYSFSSRFEEGIGTNPEELIAAAHAGCFSMKLSFILVAAGFEPTTIETVCSITLSEGSITNSHLVMSAEIPGIDQATFEKCVEEAKKTCPVSKSLSIQITHEATLK